MTGATQNPDNGLGYVCWNHLPKHPEHLAEKFRPLFQIEGRGSGGVVLYFFAVVGKVGWKIMPQERVLFLSHSAIFQCMTSAEINRCVKIVDVDEIFIEQDWIGIKAKPPEYDLLLKMHDEPTREKFLGVITTLYKELTKGSILKVSQGSKSIKSLLKVKKPKGWELHVENFVKRKDLWRAQVRKERTKQRNSEAASSAASALSPFTLDPSGVDTQPQLPINVMSLEDPSTTALLATAGPEDTTPFASPASSPLSDPAAVSPRVSQAEPIMPKITTMATSKYKVGDILQVRRSTGLWEECIVRRVEDREVIVDGKAEPPYYGVEVSESPSVGQKKQVFFSEQDTYLRALPVDAEGSTIKEGDVVVLLEELRVDGEVLQKGLRAKVLTIPGVGEGSDASVDVDGTFADVMKKQIQKVDMAPCDCDLNELSAMDRVIYRLRDKQVVFDDGPPFTLRQFTQGDVYTVPGDVAGSVASVMFDGAPETIDVFQDEIRIVPVEQESSMPKPANADIDEELPTPTSTQPVEGSRSPSPATPPHSDSRGTLLSLDDLVTLLQGDHKGSDGVVVKLSGRSTLISVELCDEGSIIEVEAAAVRRVVKDALEGSRGEEPSPPPPPPAASRGQTQQEHTDMRMQAPSFGKETSMDKSSVSAEEYQGSPRGFCDDLPSTARVSPTRERSLPMMSQEAENNMLGKLLASGDFGGLGVFVQTLCSEYRTRVCSTFGIFVSIFLQRPFFLQISELNGDLKGKTNECLNLHSVIANYEDQLRSGHEGDAPERMQKQAAKVAELQAEVISKDVALEELRARNSHTLQMLERATAPTTPPTPPSRSPSRPTAETVQLEETISFLKGRIVEVESDRVAMRTRLEEKEEQVLSLQIANESKEVDTLLLREAVVLAERRCDQYENARARTSSEVVNMSQEQLADFLSDSPPLPVTAGTVDLLRQRGISGSRLVALLEEAAHTHNESSPGAKLVSDIRAVNEQDYSNLCHMLGVQVMSTSVRRQQDDVFEHVVDAHFGQGQAASKNTEMQELAKVAWIISSRSKLVEDIYRGYQTVQMVHTMVVSSVRGLQMDLDFQQVLDRLRGASEHLSSVEKSLKKVVCNYFMDFEKLHLGIIGHKNERLNNRSRSGSAGRRSGSASGARSRSPTGGFHALESKLSLSLTPTERRVLVKLAASLYRSSHVKVRAGDGQVYHSLPPSALGAKKSMSRSPTRARAASQTSEVTQIRTTSPALSSTAPSASAQMDQNSGFGQVLYLTPPSGKGQVAVSSDVSEYCSPQRTSSTGRGRRRAKEPLSRRLHSPQTYQSYTSPPPAMLMHPRTQSPTVAFGRSALPRYLTLSPYSFSHSLFSSR